MKEFFTHGLMGKYGYLFTKDDEELIKVAIIVLIACIIFYLIAKLFNKNKIAIIIVVAAFMACGLMGFLFYFLLYAVLSFFGGVFDDSNKTKEQTDKELYDLERIRLLNELERLSNEADSDFYRNTYLLYLKDETYSNDDIREAIISCSTKISASSLSRKAEWL